MTGSQQPIVLKVRSKAKLATVLRRGITVPFVANRTGRLTMRATVAPALAKKLRLVRGRAKKPVVVARGATTVARAGDASVKLRFTAAARKRLKRARAVPLKLAGTLAGAAVSGRMTLAR